MNGMDAATGAPLDGTAHLAQSIADILSTPIGTRVMRRDYGSALFDLLDAPLNALGRLRLYAAAALAIARWEPRVRVTRLTLTGGLDAGQAILEIEGERTDTPRASDLARLSIPLPSRT